MAPKQEHHPAHHSGTRQKAGGHGGEAGGADQRGQDAQWVRSEIAGSRSADYQLNQAGRETGG